MFWFAIALVVALIFFFVLFFRTGILDAIAAFAISGIIGAMVAAIAVVVIGFFAHSGNWEVTEVALLRFEDNSHYVAITLGFQGSVYYTLHYKEEGGTVTTRSILASRAVIHEQDASDEAVATLWEDKTSLEMFYLYFGKSDFVELLVPRGTVLNNIPIGIKP